MNYQHYIKFCKKFCLLFICLFAIVFGGIENLEAQVNRTPGQSGTVILEPAAFHIEDCSAYCLVTSIKQNYEFLLIRIQLMDPGLNPGVTLTDYLNAMSENEIGIFFFHSHGSPGGIGVEYYEYTLAGETARDYAWNYYVNTLNIPSAYLSRGSVQNVAYDIGITTAGIEYWQTHGAPLSEAIVHAKACYSSTLADKWGALTALGKVGENNEVSDILVWQRMNGNEGIEKRSVGEAAEGIEHLIVYGNEDVVLSPVVKNHAPWHEECIYEGLDGFIEFDCEMNVLINPYDIITVS
ncbi:MAG: hypothetical protein GY855_17005, partial [candidate division Zixibacteria bacterium]|nr:hypothetical protein [candidate division Zixibacteria bacterium]